MVVEIKTTNKIPSITIDAEKLREVIENFISNSIKYSKIENAKLVIELKDLENDIEISFMDNGIGIPKEAQKNIFERFFRADNAKATDATGSGLGLYLTKQYVEKWGGEVSFTSDEKNTNFKVRIPKKPNQF